MITADNVRFDDRGLCVAVAQDRLTGAVRMVAWVNREALEATITTRKATFFSRSRNRLWVKGEESGNHLVVHDVALDCDGDTILILVDPLGPSCHTGSETCFQLAVPIFTGALRFAVVPSPMWPIPVLYPQHQSELSLWMPQVLFQFRKTLVQLAVPTFTGAVRGVIVPSPIWP